MARAFEDIRIIDFTQVLAGPYAVMQLGLLGAEIIKVEQPGTGDQTRALMHSGDDGMSPAFMTCNVNKKSITLNLKSAKAVEIVKRLVETADVLVESFKAGTMERMGLGYAELGEIRPDLIYCSLTGYGQNGPAAGAAAYDGAIQASSGMMSQTGHPETGPTRTGFMPVDMSTALNTAFAISASLYRRNVTGDGQHIDIAMMDTAIVMQAAQYSNYLNQGTLVGLMGNASPTKQPTANVFPTQDGFIQVTALRQNQIELLFAVIGRAQDFERAAFNTPEARIENTPLVHEFLSEALKQNTTAHWMKHLGEAGIPVAEVRELPEVVKDKQFKVREVFEQLPSPFGEGEHVTVVKAGYMTNADGPRIHDGPPLLGQHTDEVLTALGYEAAELEALRAEGVI